MTNTAQAGRRIKVTQIRSTIGFDKSQLKVVRGLGLRRIGHSIEVLDRPGIRGMIQKVRHLVRVDEV
jgi:large subunit ribosomal protein L30